MACTGTPYAIAKHVQSHRHTHAQAHRHTGTQAQTYKTIGNFFPLLRLHTCAHNYTCWTLNDQLTGMPSAHVYSGRFCLCCPVYVCVCVCVGVGVPCPVCIRWNVYVFFFGIEKLPIAVNISRTYVSAMLDDDGTCAQDMRTRIYFNTHFCTQS